MIYTNGKRRFLPYVTSCNCTQTCLQLAPSRFINFHLFDNIFVIGQQPAELRHSLVKVAACGNVNGGTEAPSHYWICSDHRRDPLRPPLTGRPIQGEVDDKVGALGPQGSVI